jgi:hypothetical protein
LSSSVTETDSVEDLGVILVFKLNFHNKVSYICSLCIKLLGLVRSINFTFSSLECLCISYFTSVRSKLEYASVIWNSIRSADTNRLKRTQQTFAALCFKGFFPQVHYSLSYALAQLNLTPFIRGGAISIYLSSFKFTLVLNSALLFWNLSSSSFSVYQRLFCAPYLLCK